MNEYDKLLLQNKAWSEEMKISDKNYFKRLESHQTPKFLFIGCSDSRVPATEITGTEPGDLFVHRNIANMVVHTDLNLLSVLQYAIEVLHVEHIIVCGHYGCGGVKASLTHQHMGLINKWLRNIKEVYKMHENELNAIQDETEKLNKLTELNVIEQCNDLVKTSIVQKAWKNRKGPQIHGWVYGLGNGIITELISIEPNMENIHPLFRYDLDSLDEL